MDAELFNSHALFFLYHVNNRAVLILPQTCVDTVLSEITQNPPEGVIAGPKDEDNLFEWEAVIVGPEGTAYEDGVFTATLSFPKEYPMEPPKMAFVSRIFHPNVFSDGDVCISILHAPGDDPLGYESRLERWSPVQSIEKILLSVVSMLAEPNLESSANVDASKVYRDDPAKYRKIAQDLVRSSLGLWHVSTFIYWSVGTCQHLYLIAVDILGSFYFSCI